MVAISDEPVATLKSKMVKERGATYWIGSDPKNQTLVSFVGEGPLGIPQFYLVDATGTVVGMEIPREAVIEKLLAETFSLKLEKTLHRKLERARLAYEHGAYTTAFEAAGKLLEDKDQVVVADARLLRRQVSRYAAHRRKIMEAELQTSDPGNAYGNLLLMKHQLAGIDPKLQSWVDGALRRLARTGEIKAKAESKAWRLFEKTLRRDLKGFASDYERGRVQVLYKELADDHRRTTAAVFAKKRLERLGTGR